MTPERLAEIGAEIAQSRASDDLYIAGLVSADLAEDLLAEVERLRALCRDLRPLLVHAVDEWGDESLASRLSEENRAVMCAVKALLEVAPR